MPDDEFSPLDLLLWKSFTAFPFILSFSPLSSPLTMLLLLLLLLLMIFFFAFFVFFYFFFFFVFSLSLLLVLLLTVGRESRGRAWFFLFAPPWWMARGFYGCWKHTNLITSEGTFFCLAFSSFLQCFLFEIFVWYVNIMNLDHHPSSSRSIR
jgi:hypothetical protein